MTFKIKGSLELTYQQLKELPLVLGIPEDCIVTKPKRKSYLVKELGKHALYLFRVNEEKNLITLLQILE